MNELEDWNFTSKLECPNKDCKQRLSESVDKGVFYCDNERCPVNVVRVGINE